MRISKGDFGTLNLDKREGSSTNFMPDDLEIICTICIKLYKRGIIFFSLPHFPPRMENQRH